MAVNVELAPRFFGLTTIRLVALSTHIALSVTAAITAPSAVPAEAPTPSDHRAVQLPVSLDMSTTDITRPILVDIGVIMHDFEPPAQRWLSGHRGIDFAADPGDPVYAIAEGTVSFSGTVAGKPVVSVSRADGTRVTYEPLESDLAVGAPVFAGDLLGHTAAKSMAHCQDRCIHVGHVDGRDYLDPWRLMGGWVQIVLKPN
jgi:murein DD-endopeptidase MepM/ murein hydrolase activator NlpD